MPDRLFYIGGEWLTYEQAHRLGYTILPPKILTLYTSSNTPTSVRKDIQTDQYYDSSNLRWVDDFNELGLYSYINTITCFKGESSDDYRGYSSHANSNEITHILYDGVITDLNYLYTHSGVTLYKCTNIMLDSSNNPIVWYDSKTNKYFDDREVHAWVDRIDDVQVTLYDTYTNTPTQIYENETSFFLNGSSISKEDFYSNDNYGIIRDTLYTFKDSLSYEAYYDSYSDEYCIPNVTDVWVSRNDIIALGYLFIEGLAELWQCITPLYLPWKYLPRTVTITFTNNDHPELDIDLPNVIEDSIGTEIIIPYLSGIYEDSSYHKYRPVSWDIGEFGSTFVLLNNTIANIILEPVEATVSFTNTVFPDADVDLPGNIIISTGGIIKLPTVFGLYKDSNDIKWAASHWSEGNFDSVYTVIDDISIDLVWVQVSTYNVIDDQGIIIHSAQSVVYTAPVDAYVQDRPPITYNNIDSIIIGANEIIYANIDPIIQAAQHLIISSSEAIPPADLVVYNEDTGEIYSSIFKRDAVTFSTSHLIVDNPNTEIVTGSNSFIILGNAIEDIVTAQTDYFTIDNSDLQTICITVL